MPKAASVALLLLLAALLPAQAQPLYKWIDDTGRTQYSDKPPKNFKGEVTRVDTEVEKTTFPPPPAPPARPAPEKAKAAVPADDILTRRRATRASLETRLAKARENVEVARKALAKAETPEPDERQIIQQRVHGGMHGMTERSNCRVEGSGNQKILMCPTSVPTEEYRERVARLEEAMRKAEAELEAAEVAWRRGVD